MAHKTTTSKQVPEAGLFTSIARVQWVAYVSTAWYCSSLYSCYNGRQDTIVKFFNIIYFCVVKSVTLTVCTVHFGPTTYWFTATISGGSLTRGTWLLGTENCTKIIFSVCVYCKLLLVCNYIKKYHIYVVVHQFKDVPATPTEPQCLKMFFTSILKQFVPLTSPPISQHAHFKYAISYIAQPKNVFTLLQHMMSSFRVVSQYLGLYYAAILFSVFLPFIVGSHVTMLAESVAQVDGW